ncbi:hypothetical protein SAMN02799630_00434 [Paenibacillus sp. UNCCL117]|uniref:hypothetical protein n=1 Tax=unclassified Paenibacillus TaxID=185978 RepID=UPI00089017A4|nr:MULTISPECIES: hypothetical protein [unclassified Paenibacillus]SDC40248.1 hypothetical protein SAMN04488602_10298 [Paenibacillus sp. cl123]SFW13859.1 hypothetical protein SAMN02799630_00434 [Paenibacillus sp. UNCCL117]
MRWIPRLLILTLLSAGIAVGLSYVLKLEESAAVFRMNKPVQVTEANIVDIVSRMPLHLRIRSVEVSRTYVSIDLIAVTTTDKGDTMQDVYEIPRSMFAASTNINQVFVRVLDVSGEQRGGGQLLVAASAKRDKAAEGDDRHTPVGLEEIQAYVDSHYQMTYTPIWKERHRSKDDKL